MTKTIILYSGGADSALLVLLAKRLGHQARILTFRYGQKHEEEVDMGLSLLGEIAAPDMPSMEVDLTAVFRGIHSNIFSNSMANYPGVHNMHLPARNGVFVMVALGVAENLGFDEVWIGCDYSDRVGLFPDCYQEWIVKMDALAQCNGSRKIRVKAPLLGLEKEDVKALLQAEGVDLDKVYSGYVPPAARVDGKVSQRAPMPTRSG